MIILNEVKYAKECIEEGIVGDKPYETLSLLARYYYHIEGKRKKQIATLLEKHLVEHYQKYAKERKKWQDAIEKISANAGKFAIHEIQSVTITKNEMAKIGAINSSPLQRLAFALLCFAKWGNLKNPNNDGWVNRKMREVFNLARVRVPASEMGYKINALWLLGYLELPQKITAESVRVTFIDDESEPALEVSDFRELGFEYLMYCGGNYIRCANCGIIVQDNRCHNKLYCKRCATYQPVRTKVIKCVDCGESVEIPAKANKTIRCNKCQNEYNKSLRRVGNGDF